MAMEVELHHPHHHPPENQTTFKAKSSSRNGKSNFLRVRQRPSGKWVAEIKNTRHKIRVWLGTFDTAEEAAQAYDEAAFILRGSNTRTNFVNNRPCNAALSRRIRNLVNQKKSLISCQPTTTPTISSIREDDAIHTSNTVNAKAQMVEEYVYRPDINGHFDYSWAFPQQFPTLVPGDLGGLFPKHSLATSESEMTNQVAFPEFERMRVERQISASLYAMNGVADYLDCVCNDHGTTIRNPINTERVIINSQIIQQQFY